MPLSRKRRPSIKQRRPLEVAAGISDNQTKFDMQGAAGMLIAFGGLPGTGKTTVAQTLARKLAAVYLRIDSLEQALIASGAAGRISDLPSPIDV